MKTQTYTVYIKTLDEEEYTLKTKQTIDEILNYNDNYGLVGIEDINEDVYIFATRNILVIKHS